MANLSQIHGATDELSTDDEQFESSDEQLDYLDQTLGYVNIIKINTSYFEKYKNVLNRNDLKHAQCIIERIVSNGRKRKAPFGTNAPNAKYPRIKTSLSLPAESSKSTQAHKHDIPRLELNPQVMHMLKEKGVNFKLHLYLVENLESTQFSKVFSRIVTGECKKRLCREKEVAKSYMLFFYRNVKKGGIFTPEIYALTTGVAWKIVIANATTNFVNKIERRLLRFPYLKVDYNLIDGPISSISKMARPGHEITLKTWDYLGILVKNRTRQIRENSSLYSSDIDAFLTKKGKHIKSRFQISENKLQIQRRLKLSQLGLLLNHFSKISSNKKTYLVNDENEEEKDDPMFQMYDYASSVTNKELCETLNKTLYTTLQHSMNGKHSKINLMHMNISTWMKADEFSLQCLGSMIKSTPGPKTKARYKTVRKWNDFPCLDDVMETLKKTCGQDFRPEWLDKVIIKFGNKKAPLKECINSRFSAGGIGTYPYHHGKWIEIKAEFFYSIERDFVEILKPHLFKPCDLPMLLPWKHPKFKKKTNGKKNERKFQLQPFTVKTMKSKWNAHYHNVCKRDMFEQCLTELKSLSEDKTDPTCDFQQMKGMSPQKKAAYLYRFLESELKEDSYNSSHTLLNRILPGSSDTRIITCDKKLVNGIELCDIMIFDKSATYLVHVKASFNGESIRAICSQIRNAADFIHREITLGKGNGIIDQYWKELTKAAKNPQTHENEVKRVLENMTGKEFKEKFRAGRDIFFVLACRDLSKKADFTENGSRSFEVNIAEEIKEQFNEKSCKMIARLKKEKFLNEKGDLTSKFILDGKNKKEAFIAYIKEWECIEDEKTARKLSGVLMSGLSKSKSTIAKLEIMKLIDDFEKCYFGESKLQLRVLSINKDFP